ERDVSMLAKRARKSASDPALAELVALAAAPLETNDIKPVRRDPAIEAQLAALVARDNELRHELRRNVEKPRRRHRGFVVRPYERLVMTASGKPVTSVRVTANGSLVAVRPGARPAPLIVPDDVLAAIREHALSVPEGLEVVGRIVASGERAMRYVPLTNRSTKPYTFKLIASWLNGPGERSLVCHRPPPGPPPKPSA